MDAATASGNHLVTEVLDDPAVTKRDLGEMGDMWEEVCVKSVRKQERLDKAQEVNSNSLSVLQSLKVIMDFSNVCE